MTGERDGESSSGRWIVARCSGSSASAGRVLARGRSAAPGRPPPDGWTSRDRRVRAGTGRSPRRRRPSDCGWRHRRPRQACVNAELRREDWLADLEDATRTVATSSRQVSAYLTPRSASRRRRACLPLRTDRGTAVRSGVPFAGPASGTCWDGAPASARWSLRVHSSTTRRALARAADRTTTAEMESHEARLERVFVYFAARLGVPTARWGHGADRSIPAAFEMDEIFTSCASRLRPERRPLGLPFQLIKVFLDAGATSCCGPRLGHDDRAEELRTHPVVPHATAAGVRWVGWASSQPQDEEGTVSRWRMSVRTSSAGAPASTARGWPTPTWSRSAARCSTRCSATGRTSSTPPGRCSTSARSSCWTPRRCRASGPRPGCG